MGIDWGAWYYRVALNVQTMASDHVSLAAGNGVMRAEGTDASCQSRKDIVTRNGSAESDRSFDGTGRRFLRFRGMGFPAGRPVIVEPPGDTTGQRKFDKSFRLV